MGDKNKDEDVKRPFPKDDESVTPKHGDEVKDASVPEDER